MVSIHFVAILTTMGQIIHHKTKEIGKNEDFQSN